MIPLTRDAIFEYYNDTSEVFQRFYSYNYYEDKIAIAYKENKIYATTFIDYRQTSVEVVLKDYDYNNNIEKASCTCEQFKRDNKPCKHILYVLIGYSKLYENTIAKELKRKAKIQNLFDTFLIDEEDKVTVNVEPTLILDSVFPENNAMTFKIGLNKMSVVTNVKKLLMAVLEKEELKFTKTFTFDPRIQKFDYNFNEFLDYLNSQLEIDSQYSSEHKIINTKFIKIKEKNIFSIIKYLKNVKFDVIADGEHYENCKVITDENPISIDVIDNDGKLTFEFDQANLFPLINNYKYVFHDGNLYVQNQRDTDETEALLSLVYDEVELTGDDRESFINSVLPKATSKNIVKADTELLDQVKIIDFKPKIYIERFGTSGILVKVLFYYDDEAYNPLSSEEFNKIDRKKYEEQAIIDMFVNFVEDSEKQGYILSDNKAIYDFLVDYVPVLREKAEIFYDSKLNLNLFNKSSSTFKVSMNKRNLLEVDFEVENVNKEELKDLYTSIKQKKKFHRLKNGDFITIDEEMINSFNMLDGLNISKKDLSKKTIEVPKYHTHYINNALSDFNIEISDTLKDYIEGFSTFDVSSIEKPKDFKPALRDYQVQGFNWLKTLEHFGLGGILADDMGLGKTIQVLAFLCASNPHKTLIIAPTSLVYNWEAEIKEHAPSLNYLVISGSIKERNEAFNKIDDHDIIITSYALIRKDIDRYKDINFKYCFIDEAQYIKNNTALSTKCLKEIKSINRFALTGTPIENSLAELYSIFDFLMPGYLGSYNYFRETFEKPIIKDEDDYVRNMLVNKVKPFILRRIKKDVLVELPDKFETNILCDLNEEQKKLYDAHLLMAQSTANDDNANKIEILALLMRLRQICVDPAMFIDDYKETSSKIEALNMLLDDLVVSDNSILIFSSFTKMLDIIGSNLDKRGLDYFRIDGSVKSKDRIDLVNRFNEKEVKVFLISLKAGGTGLNLTEASIVIHMDPWFNPQAENQATDRAHRMGQKNNVQVYKLITRNTIEERINELKETKMTLIDSIINQENKSITKLSTEDIKNLFEIK